MPPRAFPTCSSRNCVEGRAYIGKYMGIPSELLPRKPHDGTANLTIAPWARSAMRIPRSSPSMTSVLRA